MHELNSPVVSQLSSPALIQEFVPLPEMVVVDTPMVEQDSFVSSQHLAFGSKSRKNLLTHEYKC